MFGLDERALKTVWTWFLFALAVAVVYIIRSTLVTFALALFLALLLAPVVATVERFTPAWCPRTVALTIVYVTFIAAVAATLAPVGSAIAADAKALAGRLPDAMKQDFFSGMPLPAALEPLRERIVPILRERLNEIGRGVLPFAGQSLERLVTGIGALARIVFVPILAFLLLKDGRTLYVRMLIGFADGQRPLVAEIYSDLRVLLAQYVRALVVLSLITFVFYAAFLALSGAPYAVLLAGIAAALEFVPAIGPFIAAVAILGVAMLTGYTKWLLLIGFLAVYRIFLDYIVQPVLMSAGVKVHPVLVMFGVLAGGEIAGIAGVFFSVPVIAALRVILIRLHKRRVILSDAGKGAARVEQRAADST
jgi:predicted PurR-regulated permease PerM